MTVRFRAATAAALLLVALAGCSSITSVPPGPVTLGDSHHVTLGRQWSDVSILLPGRSPKVRVLSIDGPLLNRVYLAQGLAPGEGLLKPVASDHPGPVFQADMAATEVVEFVSNSVAAIGYQRVETARLRAAKFGAVDGLRFDLSAKTESGLEMRGTAEAAVAGGKLYLILYLAPSEHYFDATLPEVDAIMASAG